MVLLEEGDEGGSQLGVPFERGTVAKGMIEVERERGGAGDKEEEGL